MASNYLTLVVFAVFSFLFPVSLLLFSKMVRIRKPQNKIATLNFESAEESTGNRLTIMKEYFHYFSAFLAFEVVAAVILAWAVVARELTSGIDIAVMAFAVSGTVLEIFSIALATKRQI
jgi:NADH:ubiquinone oxidoreductase subunit 3 (subunit A)